MKNKTISIFIIAIVVAMISVTSAVSANKNTDWSESTSILDYTICDNTIKYAYTLNQALSPNTEYCLLFYTKNVNTISWLNSTDEVWSNQSGKIIECATTNDTGYFAPISGTFNFGLCGIGFNCTNNSDNYLGSVEGAKIRLVLMSDIIEDFDRDSICDWFEEIKGTDPNNPCDPNPKCTACLASISSSIQSTWYNETPFIETKITPTPKVLLIEKKKFNYIPIVVGAVILGLVMLYWVYKRRGEREWEMIYSEEE